MVDVKKVLEEFVQEQNKPTDKDRITALESAITDLAMMIVGVEDSD